MLKTFYITLLLVVSAIATIFLIANDTDVTLNYLFGSFDISLPIVIVVAFIFGLLLALLLDALVLYKQRKHIRKLEKSIQTTESELNNLRNMPMKDMH